MNEINSYSLHNQHTANQIAELNTPDPVQNAHLSQNVIICAKKYIGHIRHTPTDACFESFTMLEGTVVHDFRILFSKNIPPVLLKTTNHPIQTHEYIPLVQKKREDAVLGTAPIAREQQLRMNCWEFCLLALMDAGVLEKEQIEKLCKICTGGPGFTLVDAFQPEKATRVTEHNIKELKCGDMLFYIRTDRLENRIYHTAIFMEENKCIENMWSKKHSETVHENILDLGPFEQNSLPSFPKMVYFLPLEKVRVNIEAFIRFFEIV